MHSTHTATPVGLVSEKYQSAYYCEARVRAQVPFIFHTVLECDCNGLEYTVDGHDITIKILQGAIPQNAKLHLEVGVAMYGPFSFPNNSRPISPILWVCFLEETFNLEEFEIIVPHILTGLTKERLQYHEVCFAKASHKRCVDKYEFISCENQPCFSSSGEKSYGTVRLNHCCFYCLTANHTRDIAMDAGYCLTRIEKLRSMTSTVVYFIVTYFLESCLTVC